MPSPFAAAWAEAESRLDEAFAELVQVVPRVARPKSTPALDPTRALQTVNGRFTLRPSADRLQGERIGTEFNTMTSIATADAVLRLSVEVVADLGYALRKDDAIVLVERRGCPCFALTEAMPDHLGGVTLALVREMAP